MWAIRIFIDFVKSTISNQNVKSGGFQIRNERLIFERKLLRHRSSAIILLPDSLEIINNKTINMKMKYITTIILLFTIASFAQGQTSDHLAFKGVPIDGTLTEYVTKMKQNGFTHLGTENGIATLNGDFAGYKDCNVGVSTLNQKDLVYKIAVLFHERETWSTLSGNYFDLKQMLTEKYGNPSDVVEKFDSGSEPRDDGVKMYNVMFDNCKYYTNFQTDKGNIELSIDHDGVTSCFVKLVYFDKINSEIIKTKAKGDL